MQETKTPKVLVSMIGLDGHTTGGEVVAGILRDAGIEVVYLGIYQTPEMIVETALHEDVDAIGISSHASNYGQITALPAMLKQRGAEHILVFCGGTIPKGQIPRLKAGGIAEVFLPRSTSASIVNFVRSNVGGSSANEARAGA